MKENNIIIEHQLPHFLKAKFNSQEIGFLEYRLVEKEASLIDIQVDLAYRRQGVGLKLINELKKVSEKIFLEVRRSNLSAVCFYDFLGFKKISERKKYYSDGEDALIMVFETH